MRVASVVVFLVLTVLASACGGGDGGSLSRADAEREIERDLRALADALNDNEMAKAYTFLSEQCRDDVSLEDFTGTMLLARAFLGEDLEYEITSVHLLEHEGDRALVAAEAVIKVDGEVIEPEEGEEEEPQWMVREDGKWRSTDCEGFTQDDERGGFFDEDEEPEETRPLTSVSVGESFAVDAEDLGELFGEGSLSGTISVRVTNVETRSSIDSEFAGPQSARGKFIVVYYEIVSDLNRRMQPGTQINDELVLTDEREREWGAADYQGDYYGISGDAADAVMCDTPEGWVGAGFTGCTAVVFDVPTDAEGFALIWKDARVSVGLEPLGR